MASDKSDFLSRLQATPTYLVDTLSAIPQHVPELIALTGLLYIADMGMDAVSAGTNTARTTPPLTMGERWLYAAEKSVGTYAVVDFMSKAGLLS
jgi:hypothetical protein